MHALLLEECNTCSSTRNYIKQEGFHDPNHTYVKDFLSFEERITTAHILTLVSKLTMFTVIIYSILSFVMLAWN